MGAGACVGATNDGPATWWPYRGTWGEYIWPGAEDGSVHAGCICPFDKIISSYRFWDWSGRNEPLGATMCSVAYG